MALDQPDGGAPKRPRLSQGYLTVAIGFLIMMVSWGSYYSFGVFFKPLLEEFGWTRAMTSSPFSVAMLLEGVLCIFVGEITDRRGPRLVLTITGLSFGVGYLLMATVTSPWQLYLFLGLAMGVGISGPFNSLVPTVAQWFKTRLGLMTGMVVAGIGVGAMVVPPIATYIISAYDWRTSYAVMGAIVLVVTVIGAQFLRKSPEHSAPAEHTPAREPGNLRSRLRLLLRLGRFWAFCLIFLCYGAALFVVMVHIAPHADDLGISPIGAASLIAIIGASSTVGKLFMGFVADRFGGRTGFMIGMGGISATLFVLPFLPELWMMQVFAAVFGFCYSGCVTPQPHFSDELFGKKSLGLMLGIGSFLFTIGGAVGPLLAGYVFDTSGSYQLAFLGAAAVALVGFITACMVRSRPAGEADI